MIRKTIKRDPLAQEGEYFLLNTTVKTEDINNFVIFGQIYQMLTIIRIFYEEFF